MLTLTEDQSETRRVGRHVIYGELAAGGMAAVHLGRLVGPAGFSKAVAIKRPHQHLASEAEFVAIMVTARRTLEQRRRVFDDVDESTVNGRVDAMAAHAQESTYLLLAGPDEPKSAHVPSIRVHATPHSGMASVRSVF